jgi:hypothetical protein
MANRDRTVTPGALCRRGHDDGTGHSVRYSSGHCVRCTRDRIRSLYASSEAYRNLSLQRRARHRAERPEVAAEHGRKYRAENRAEINRRAAQRREKKRAHHLALEAARRERNRDSYRRVSRESKKKWRAESRSEYLKYHRDYYRRNSVRITLRNRAKRAIDVYGGGKRHSLRKYGVDIDAIVKHLGPCPGPRAEWHIDHIRPLASFDLSIAENVRKAFAPENHQWLPAGLNLQKSNKYAA